MEIRTTPRPNCLVCGSEGHFLYNDLQDRLFAVPGTWSLKLCNNQSCGLSWLDPTPVEADLSLLYKAYYTHEGGGSGESFIAKVRGIFYGIYRAVAYLPSAMAGLTRAKRQILHMFLLDERPGKLLDVGCGNGGFLHQMHQLGWSVTGLDFDAKAIEYAKFKYGTELTVMNSDLGGAGFPDNSFDAITMNHVVEHVPDIVGLLKESFRVLKPGGKLVAATPNIKSLGHAKFKDSWRGLEPPRHLQVFSPAALRECAVRAGFPGVKVVTTAAKADIIMGASFGLQEAKKTGDTSSDSRIKINLMRGLRSLSLQYREAFRLRHDPECGEELVLICEK